MKTDSERERSKEIQEIVAGILTAALLRIRMAGNSGDSDRCALEADHVHTVPEILGEHAEDAIAFYWEIMRPSYMKANPGKHGFEPYWARLEQLLQQPASS